MPRLLFVLRHRDQPWGDNTPYGYGLSSGLRNSVRFIVEMLELLDIRAKMVEVPNDDFIDAEVAAFKPTHVILEAFWVRPEKIPVLRKLHPFVNWFVRDHSETPFLANEGMAFAWIKGYLDAGVEVMCNSPRALKDMQVVGAAYGHADRVSYAPNYYPVHSPNANPTLLPNPCRHGPADDTIRIGCFGAIRPLKNQMAQAIAAIAYAEKIGRKLEFHINSARIEQGGNPILKNLRALFAHSKRTTLVEMGWVEHDKFIAAIKKMDVVMQVSFSETFNIVSADAVISGVPVVTSNEVPWLGAYAMANPTDTDSMVHALLSAQRQPKFIRLGWQFRDLHAYCQNTRKIWYDRFGG